MKKLRDLCYLWHTIGADEAVFNIGLGLSGLCLGISVLAVTIKFILSTL